MGATADRAGQYGLGRVGLFYPPKQAMGDLFDAAN